jgi:hypothetical protein
MTSLVSSTRSAVARATALRSPWLWTALGLLGLFAIGFRVDAANNNGAALQTAYTALNDMVNGFGKQLLTVIGFAVAAIGYLAANATSVIMKFVGYAIFLGVGLAAAVGLVGAVI